MSTEKIKIECTDRCGNSPKKELLRDFTIAYVKRDFDFCLEWIKDEITWEIVGEQLIEGKDEVIKEFSLKARDQIERLIIHNIITHGNTASVNGTMIEKENKIDFCHIYNFSGFGKNARIRKIISYMINTSI